MAWSAGTKRRSWTGGCAATTGSPTRGPPNSRPRWAVCAPTPPSLLAVWAWPEGPYERTRVVLGVRWRYRMRGTAPRGSRMEKRYRRLLALYPKDHRRDHAEEMVGVLLAADGDTQVRAPKQVAWALRFGQRAADSADLIGGALRIRARMVLNRRRRRPGLRRVRGPGRGLHRPALLHRRGGAAALPRPGPRPGPADPQRHRPGRRRGTDPRRVQRGRQGGRPARRPADRRGTGERGGRVPARSGQPPGPRAAGHPGHPLRVPVAGKAGCRPVRAARRRLGHHPVVYTPALPAAAAAGGPDPHRDLVRPPAGRRAGSSGGLRDLRT